LEFDHTQRALFYSRSEKVHDGIRVVVISGYPEVLITNGKPVAFLQKPIREEQLLASLRPALQTE